MSHSAPFWCKRRLIVTIDGPQGKSVVPLSRPFARIGRQVGSDIVLNSPWVAKRSLYLHATDEGVYCFYLQPEEKQTQRLGFWIAPGEPLMVGPYQVAAALEGDPPGPAPALVPLDDWGSASPPYPVFQVYSKGKLRDKRRFRARLNLIGRKHECALQIKGQEVSAFHGCLYWQYPRLWYVDLVSSNGTNLNGLKVDCAEVRLGDRLVVGEFTLVYQRTSKGSGVRGGASASLPPVEGSAAYDVADMLPDEFDEDMPLELDGSASVELDAARRSGPAGSTPDVSPAASGTVDALAATVSAAPKGAEEPAAAEDAAPIEVPDDAEPQGEPSLATVEAEADTARPEASANGSAAAGELALAPLQQTRQELAVLQQRVAELTQTAARAGQSAAQQLALKTREAFERQRQHIAQELARRASELAKEKLALEAQWQTASRELATQVNQLRDEAAHLARQRQAMEQSRVLWDAQRTDMEKQLRAYAEQLLRLEQATAAGLPPPNSGGPLVPAGNGSSAAHLPEPEAPRPFSLRGLPLNATASVEENEAATAMVLAAAQQSGGLRPPPPTRRSHVVDSHVETSEEDFPEQRVGAAAFHAEPAALSGPAMTGLANLGGADVLEGSVGPAVAAIAPPAADSAATAKPALPSRTIKGRKTAKGKEAFDVVTDRLVEMEQQRRHMVMVLGIAGAVVVVALAAAMIVAAIMLR